GRFPVGWLPCSPVLVRWVVSPATSLFTGFPGPRLPWSSAERTEKHRLVGGTGPWATTHPDSADLVQRSCSKPGDVGGGVARSVRREAQPAVGWEKRPLSVCPVKTSRGRGVPSAKEEGDGR